MNAPSSGYTPISCDFHDVLEATALRRHPVAIHFVDNDGSPRQSVAVIVDITAHDGVEHLQLDDGTRIRLDHLVEVDGQRLADFSEGT